MARPPFPLSVKLPREVCPVRVRIELARRKAKVKNPLTGKPYTLRPSIEVVRIFAQATNAQLFNDRAVEPAARMALIRETKTATGLSWVYATRGVRPASYLALLGLLTQTYYAGDPLRSVAIEAAAPDGDLLDTSALLDAASEVQSRPPGLPFRYDNRKASRRAHVISFEFEDMVSSDRYSKLEEWLVLWDNLLVLGGFSLDFAEEEDLRRFGELAHISPCVVEYRLEPFLEYRSAVHSLLVLSKNFHLAGQPLESLTVE